MIKIIEIQKSILSDNFVVREHADEEMENDSLEFSDIVFSIMNGEIIESYSQAFPFPACLLSGKGFKGEPIHSVWGYDSRKETSYLITVYKPDTKKWSEDFKKRLPK